MPFPQVAGTNNSQEAAADTVHTLLLPASIVVGELLLAWFTYNGGTNALGVTWVTTGWTQVFLLDNGVNHGGELRYRFADGTEGASVSITTTAGQRAQHWSARISGAHASQAPAAGTAVGGGATANPNPPSCAPSWGAEDNLWMIFHCNDLSAGATINVSTFPTNYATGAVQFAVANTAGVNLSVCRRELNAASEDPGTFTLSAAENNVLNTIAIRPAAAASFIPYRNPMPQLLAH